MATKIESNIIGEIRNTRIKNFSLPEAFRELIDNSRDACATKIKVYQTDDGDLVIEDNGRGFSSQQSLEHAFFFNMSDKKPGEGIGQHGIGFKDAATKFSSSTSIHSGKLIASVNWDEICMGTSEPVVNSATAANFEGTRITLESFSEKRKHPIKFETITRSYYPAMKAGKLSIEFNGVSQHAPALPKFKEEINESLKFRGKKATVVGGTFKPSDKARDTWAGYNVFVKGRLIGKGNITTMGVGDTMCSNFCFMVFLDDGEDAWALDRNKNTVGEPDELSQLLSLIYDSYTRPLLKRAEEQSIEVSLKAIEDEINAALAGKAGNQRRTKKGKKKGTIDGTGKGSRKRRTFTDDAEGDYSSQGRIDNKNTRRRTSFKFVDLGGTTLGQVVPFAKGVSIEINSSHTKVSEWNAAKGQVILDQVRQIASLYYNLQANWRYDSAKDRVNGILRDQGEELYGI